MGWVLVGAVVSAVPVVTVAVVVAGVVVVSGLAVVPVGGGAPNAAPASGPPRLAAVRPPPASAESTARKARRRAALTGGMRWSRSSRGRPMVVVGEADPQSLGTPTAIHIGRQAGIRKGFVIGLAILGASRIASRHARGDRSAAAGGTQSRLWARLSPVSPTMFARRCSPPQALQRVARCALRGHIGQLLGALARSCPIRCESDTPLPACVKALYSRQPGVEGVQAPAAFAFGTETRRRGLPCTDRARRVLGCSLCFRCSPAPARARAAETVQITQAGFSPAALGSPTNAFGSATIASTAGPVPSPIEHVNVFGPAGMTLDLTGQHDVRRRNTETARPAAPARPTPKRASAAAKASTSSARKSSKSTTRSTCSSATTVQATCSYWHSSQGHTPVSIEIVFGGSVIRGPRPYGLGFSLDVPLIKVLPEASDASATSAYITLGAHNATYYQEGARQAQEAEGQGHHPAQELPARRLAGGLAVQLPGRLDGAGQAHRRVPAALTGVGRTLFLSGPSR